MATGSINLQKNAKNLYRSSGKSKWEKSHRVLKPKTKESYRFFILFLSQYSGLDSEPLITTNDIR